jgi:hypothetical protein
MRLSYAKNPKNPFYLLLLLLFLKHVHKFQLNVLDRVLLNSWLVFTWKNIANLLYEVSKYKMGTYIKKNSGTLQGGVKFKMQRSHEDVLYVISKIFASLYFYVNMYTLQYMWAWTSILS